jgi:biopolymer transport protein TolR
MRVNANSRFSNKLISRIDVSAFASIMLFLFVLLMLTNANVGFVGHGVSVALVRVTHPILVPHAQREDAITIAINRQGDIFVGRDLIRSYSSIPDRIRESIKHGSESTIYIRADARTKYWNVKDVLDEIHSAGVEKIVFVVDQSAPPSSGK